MQIEPPFLNLSEEDTPAHRASRKKAVRRSWVCPGAGFALAGWRFMALATFALSVGAIVPLIWFALAPSAAALWTFVAVLVVAAAFWVAEQVMIGRIAWGTPRPAFLVSGFPFVVAGLAVVLVLPLVLLFCMLGSLQLAGGGMSPTLEKGEKILYQKRVDNQRLRPGALIVYKLSNQSAWGQPGWVTISRILAAPGDRLSVRDGRYLVNDVVGPPVATTEPYAPVIAVPEAPISIQVPEQCYFIVQDSAGQGYDSRVLGWIQGADVVSTELYYLRARELLKRVD
jgi:signal peptidase I